MRWVYVVAVYYADGRPAGWLASAAGPDPWEPSPDLSRRVEWESELGAEAALHQYRPAAGISHASIEMVRVVTGGRG